MPKFLPIPEAQLQPFNSIAQQLARGRPAFGAGQQLARNIPGPGLEFKDFRDYVPGEDSGRIDWRASQRSGDLLVRQYHGELSTRWLLCLDNSASMSAPAPDKWRLAAQVTSAFAYLLLQAGHQVGLVRFSERVDHYLPCAAGHSHYLRLLQDLQAHKPRANGGGSSLSCIRELATPAAHIAIFSDCLLPGGLQHELLALARPGRQFRLTQILSDDEVQLPATGALELVDTETGASQVAWVDNEADTESALSELRESLAVFCRRAQIPFSSNVTSHSWQQVVRQQFQAGAYV